MKKITALVLGLTLALSLTACGSKNSMDSITDFSTDESINQPYVTKSYTVGDNWDTGDSVSKSETSGNAVDGTKMIYTACIGMQTTEFDQAMQDMNALVKKMGGYYEQTDISNYSGDYRSASITVRVPSEQFEEFCNQTGEICHVIYSSSNATNISENYYDVESRLTTAQTKLTRLQELLTQAKDMNDIITIESAISETEQEIDSLSGTLHAYDSEVDYATVSIELSEVYRLSDTEETPQTLGQKISNALKEGASSVGEFLEELVILIAYCWLWIVIIIVIAVAILVLVKKSRKRRSEKIKALNESQAQKQKSDQ